MGKTNRHIHVSRSLDGKLQGIKQPKDLLVVGQQLGNNYGALQPPFLRGDFREYRQRPLVTFPCNGFAQSISPKDPFTAGIDDRYKSISLCEMPTLIPLQRPALAFESAGQIGAS